MYSQVVEYEWRGVLTGTGEAFVEPRTARVRIGDADVPPGVELGLRHLRVGDEAEVRCDSRFAYGYEGRTKATAGDLMAVPPDTDVTFTLVMKAFGDANPVGAMDDRARVAEAENKRHIGNDFFAHGQFGKGVCGCVCVTTKG